MNIEVLKELKKQLLEIQKKNIIYISKNLFYLIMSCIIIATSSKVSGLGFPYVIDKEKKYRIENLNYNNINGITNSKEVRYKFNEELENYQEDNNTITIKSKYELDEEGNYYRKVIVYKLNETIENPKENTETYETITNNYKDYTISKNKKDEYIEYSEEVNNLWFYNTEIIINYNIIDKNKYIEIPEEEMNNRLISILYSILVFCAGNYFVANINEKIIYNKSKIEDIKKKIKEEKSH